MSGCINIQFMPPPLNDDFSSYNLGEKAPFGPWKVKGNGTFTITPIFSEDNKVMNKVVEAEGDGIMYVDRNYTNFVYYIDIKRKKLIDSPKIYFRLNGDATAGYCIVVEPFDRGYKLYKFNGTKWVLLNQTYNAAPAEVSFFRYMVIANGNKITFKVNAYTYITYIDKNPILEGGIGFGGQGYFDNVRVEPLEE